MSKQLRVLALLAATALAGCASVDAGDIQQFGAATTAVAEAARNARTIDNTLARAIRTEEQATVFAMGGGTYDFPPTYRATLASGVVWDRRIAYAVALADYGKALAKAASGVESSDLGTAVDNMQKAVSTAVPVLAERANFEPIAIATSAVVKQAITQAAWQRIRGVMHRAHPAIVQGRDLLATDFALLAGQAKRHYDDWLSRKKAALDTIRRHGSASEKYQAYRAFLAEQQIMAVTVELLVPAGKGAPGYVAMLNDMVAAHKQLADAKPDPVTLAEFVAAAQQLEAFAKLFASNGG
jgi:outer membrane lipoprotein SlyB